jgi:hypothetical protein
VLEPATFKQLKQPSRAAVVLAAALVQLGGAAALVIGLAAIPMTHDLHMHVDVLVAWIAAALVALASGALAYRARILALLVAAVTMAGLGFVLPRGDSAVGVLVHLLPRGDISEGAVQIASIAMFAIAAACIAVLPWALAYRSWLAGQDTSKPGRTLLGFGAAMPEVEVVTKRPSRRVWLLVTCGAVAIGALVGITLV